MAVSMALLVFAGFAQSFYLSHWFDQDSRNSVDPVFYYHGLVFTAWILLLVAQPTLIALGRFTDHRRLGQLGVAVTIAVVIFGVYAAPEAASRPHESASPPKTLEFVGVVLFGIFMYALLVASAIALRHRPQYHKRLMLLATINLLQAAVVRLPIGLPAIFGASQGLLVR